MGGTKLGKDVAQAVIEVAWTTLNQQEEMELKNLLTTEQLEHQILGERFLVYKKIVEEQLETGVQNQNLVDTTNRSHLASEACESSCAEITSTTPYHVSTNHSFNSSPLHSFAIWESWEIRLQYKSKRRIPNLLLTFRQKGREYNTHMIR